MSVISRPDGSVQRSRLAGDSTWVMMCSASRRVQSGRATGSVAGEERRAWSGSLSSQSCWRMAWKNTLSAPIRRLLDAVSAGLGHQPGEVAFQQRPVDVGERVDAGAVVRNSLNRVRASTPARAAPMLSPDVSRSRVHRLARSRSQGWAMRSNRSRAGRHGLAGRRRPGQPVQPPDVAGILDLPAGAVAQGLDHVAGVEQELATDWAGLAAALDATAARSDPAARRCRSVCASRTAGDDQAGRRDA